MPELETPTFAALATLTGATLATNLLFALARRTLALNDAMVERFGPIIAVVIGVVVVTVSTLLLGGFDTPAAVGEAVWTGIMAGLLASGLYSGAKRLSGG